MCNLYCITTFLWHHFLKKSISKHIHYKNWMRICQKYTIKEPTKAFLLRLEKEARRLTTIHMLPKFVLTGLLTFCQQKSVIKPAYSTFQDIISQALKSEKKSFKQQTLYFNRKTVA
ncbi:transposase [Photorhabdus temperata subsp. temperata M1021]|nr:transposase [Photorhabdus temperata subsp. temperata M1021]